MVFGTWNIMMEINNVNEFKKGTELCNTTKKGDICISSDNDVRKDDNILVNGFKYKENIQWIISILTLPRSLMINFILV